MDDLGSLTDRVISKDKSDIDNHFPSQLEFQMSTEMNKADNMMFMQPQAQTLNIQIPQHSTLKHSQSNTALSSKRFIPQVVNIKQQKQQMAKISS
jgi:hypothetical protein